MIDTTGKTKQFNEFGGTLAQHTEHLMVGVRYWRGCPWCELQVAPSDLKSVTPDTIYYEAAQAGPQKQLKFGETPANLRAVYDKYAGVMYDEEPAS